MSPPFLISAALSLMLALLITVSSSLLEYKALNFLRARNSPARHLAALAALAITFKALTLITLILVVYTLFVCPEVEALPSGIYQGVDPLLLGRFPRRTTPVVPVSPVTPPVNATTPIWTINMRNPLRTAASAALMPTVVTVILVALFAALLGQPPCGS